jgi:hypothetical protein
MRAMLTTLAAALLAATCAAQAPESPKPGPEHELLKKQVGTWDCVMKGPGGETKGTMKFEMILGGLWLKSDFDGEFMPGQKFQGHGLDSYDAGKKKFVSVWVDTMSATPTIFEGTYDEKTKKFTQVTTQSTPGPDGKPMTMKSVMHMVDDDHMEFTMNMVADGKDTEMMTLKYTRKK